MQYALCNSGMQHALMQEQLLTAYCLLLTANFTQHMNTQEDRQSHMQTVTVDLAASGSPKASLSSPRASLSSPMASF